MSIPSPYPRRARNGKVFAGLILLAVGGLLLLNRLDFFFFPDWLFSWPTFLIVLGLFIGAKNDFRKPSWFILVILGIAFLLDDIFESHEMRQLIWPILLIALGIWLVFRRNHRADHITWDARINPEPTITTDADKMAADPFAGQFESNDTYTPHEAGTAGNTTSTPPPHPHDDFVDATSVFAGVKRKVLSKNFKGGDIVNIFGGTEIDFSQADINGKVMIDITQLMGGIKLIVPPHWQVISAMSAVLSGVDDKRKVFGTVQQSPDKILELHGVSILGGVDIRTY
jgi:hypothetical protein